MYVCMYVCNQSLEETEESEPIT